VFERLKNSLILEQNYYRTAGIERGWEMISEG